MPRQRRRERSIRSRVSLSCIRDINPALKLTPFQPAIHQSICDASDFVELCALYGYTAEEHVVQTKDGYLLGVHRLAWRKGEEDLRVNAGPNSIKKRVVYLHHGLLMNSEIWVCLTDAHRCLPFVLVERGFDVWVRSSLDPSLNTHTNNRSSWEIIVETNTRRNLSNIRPTLSTSGTSRSTNLLSMIYLTPLPIYWNRLSNRHYHISDSRKEQPSLLLPWPFILSSTTRLTSLLPSHRLCPLPAYLPVLSMH